jgi:hypothetical protein
MDDAQEHASTTVVDYSKVPSDFRRLRLHFPMCI